MKSEWAYARYSNYRDSGIEWLGNVPSHWDVPAFRRVGTILNGADHKPFEVEDGGYPVFGSGGEFARCARYLSNGPSLLLGRKGTINQPLFVNQPFWTVDTMYYTKITSNCLASFLHYVALACFPFDMYTYGSALPSMTQRDYYTFPVPVPPHIEQVAIVNFLDHELTKIDTLIEKQQLLISLLTEKRQAVISHAVTKGLNSNVPMKDSGIEWLGRVPTHWNVCKLSYSAVKIGDGLHGTPEYTDVSPYRFVNGSNLISGEINIHEGCPYVPEKEYLKYRLPLNDKTILLSINGTIGNVAYYRGEAVVLGKSAAFINCDIHLLPSFLFSVLKSSYAWDYFMQSSGGTTINNLSLAAIRSLPVALPLIGEQEQIVHVIQEQCNKIDMLIEKAKQSIDLMKERRSALISAAVTGKIDVRGFTKAGMSYDR